MEVHHHPIAIGSHTPRKSWTHYLWEFLMLFLAVFCGFLAEYQLEHKIEREREEEYMKGMVDDLESDTTNLNFTHAFVLRITKGLDSLQQDLYNSDASSPNAVAIYRHNGIYLRRFAVNFSDQTATQLRNAGTLRLIRKRKVVDAISMYWRGIRQVERIEDRLDESVDEIASLSDNIINRSHYLAFSRRDPATGIIQVTVDPNATLLSSNKELLINFANKINRLKSRIENFYVSNLNTQKEQADSLIQLIKEEYHLK